MKIALLGTRGIPANYGGFETFAEELAPRLVDRGHSVTVYCRNRHTAPKYKGVDLAYLPTIRHKYFDTLAHTGISTLHLLFHRHDAVLYCNAANAIFTWMPRVLGMPVALNVDGLERKRKKWNALARTWYLASEWMSTKLPSHIVTDAEKIQEYYLDRYKAGSTFIAYGAETGKLPQKDIVEGLGLRPDQYFLYVSRLEPENNALLVREAFEKVATPLQLALIGDAPYAHGYIAQVKDTRDPRIVIPGAIYGVGYKQLQSHCYAYIHATEVGGTHPALIEAMGRGALVLYLDTVENAEVAGGVGIPFHHNTLVDVLKETLRMPQHERDALGAAARARVEQRYGWEKVTSDYEHLFEKLLSKP
ncbi:glycosyl transferase [Bryobacterales bacterium F-183]|nr:glycosyl transferase [Bryobacterales bacterium F-183]